VLLVRRRQDLPKEAEMKRALVAVLVLSGWLCAASEAQELASGPKGAVIELLAAFNAHDVDMMLEACAEDIMWMSVGPDKIVVEASGANALHEGMAAYFKSVPSASSVLRSAVESGPFVVTVEEASWESGGEKKSQCSAAVYEVKEGKVQNVWYFPSHKCE
jgi:hypothetical protein